MRGLSAIAVVILLFGNVLRAAEGDLVEIMIVPLQNEVPMLFPANPQIQSATVKNDGEVFGKVVFSKKDKVPGTDHYSEYIVEARVNEFGSRLYPQDLWFSIRIASFRGFAEDGEGRRLPLMDSSHRMGRLPSSALNGGWYAFEVEAPRPVPVRNHTEEIEPAPEAASTKAIAMLFIRWSRAAAAQSPEF